MSNFGFHEMQKMQKELHHKYEDRWGKISSEQGRELLLWMMAEAGEVADIMKKKGNDKIMDDKETRSHFIEELGDVLMYLNDIMLCYSITPEEIETIYMNKHNINMNRW